MAATAGGNDAMSAEQRELYYAMDAWLMQRSNMNDTDPALKPHFNQLLAYMKELASAGFPRDPEPEAEFDTLLTSIAMRLSGTQETNEFYVAWDAMTEDDPWVPMDEIDERYGMHTRDDDDYDDYDEF